MSDPIERGIPRDEDQEMDATTSDEQPQQPKRSLKRIVDADDPTLEIPDPKRPKLMLNKQK